MIEQFQAQRLVDNILAQFGYSINVMNINAIIIASADASRIGSFHQGAYDLIQKKRPIYIARDASDGFIGIKPGVTTLLNLNDQVVGAFGISGNPDEILPILNIVKFAFETMLEYEWFKTNKRLNSKTTESFVGALLFGEPFNQEKVNKYAKLEGYTASVHRIPILVKFDAFENSDSALGTIRSLLHLSKQDLVLQSTSDNIIIFKTVSSNEVNSYKRYTESFVEEMRSPLRKILSHKDTADFGFFVGVPVLLFKHYAKSMSYAEWLSCLLTERGEKLFFFSDYLLEYMWEKLPQDDLAPITLFYAELISQSMDIKAFCQVVDSFFRNNMDVKNCSNELFLHKNTLLQRLKKIKTIMEIGNFKNVGDDILLSVLSYIFRENEKNLL